MSPFLGKLESPNEQEASVANVPLKGSERHPMTGAKIVAPADPTERLEVTVLVRRGASAEFHSRVSQIAAGKSPGACMSRDEFAISRHAPEHPEHRE